MRENVLSQPQKISPSIEMTTTRVDYRDIELANPEVEEATPVTNGLDREVNLTTYTLSQVSDHCTPSDCWLVIRDMVYDLTEFVGEHPGGDDIILENAGTDATFAFRSVGHSKAALKEMEQYLIGTLVECERLNMWCSSPNDGRYVSMSL